MIYYVSHWDWVLLRSRSDIVNNLKNKYKIVGVTPLKNNAEILEKSYYSLIDWKLKRENLIDLFGIYNLNKIIKNIDSNDILHIFTLKSLIYFLLTFQHNTKRPKVVCSITGLGFLFSNSKISSVLRKCIKPVIKRKINKYVDVLIFQNEDNKNQFLEFSDYKNNVYLIEGSGLKTDNLSLKTSFDKKLKIIYIGRLLKEKGINEYLKIASSFEDTGNLEFYVAGDIDPGNKSSLNNEELRLLKNQINYLGNINIKTELLNYDILISPSYHEGFSRVVLESAYVGLYCIVNDIPGTRNLINVLNCGTLVKENKIEDYIKIIKKINEEIRTLDNSSIRSKIEENYSVMAISKKFDEIYSKYV